MVLLYLLGLLAAGCIPFSQTLICYTCVNDETKELFCRDLAIPNGTRKCPHPFTHCVTMNGKDKNGKALVYRDCACYDGGGLERCDVGIEGIEGWKGCGRWCNTDLCNGLNRNSASRTGNCRKLTAFCFLACLWASYWFGTY